MDTNEAFETLLRQLRQSLKQAQEEGSRAFQEERFDDAHGAAERGQEIAERIQHLEVLQQGWGTLIGEPPPAKAKRQHLPRGEGTPQAKYLLPVLMALEEMGGRGQTKEVIARVGALLKDQLVEADFEILTGGQPRWEKNVNWARYTLKEQGLLAPDSPRGVWEITDAGWAYLGEYRAELRKDQ